MLRRQYHYEMLDDEVVATQVIGAAIEVHQTLGGPGLLEAVYEEAFCYELRSRHLGFERQKTVPLVYKGRCLTAALRVDVLVENRVVIECKAASSWNPVFKSQALTYLRLLDLRLALVINFGAAVVKDGIHRVVNGY